MPVLTPNQFRHPAPEILGGISHHPEHESGRPIAHSTALTSSSETSSDQTATRRRWRRNTRIVRNEVIIADVEKAEIEAKFWYWVSLLSSLASIAAYCYFIVVCWKDQEGASPTSRLAALVLPFSLIYVFSSALLALGLKKSWLPELLIEDNVTHQKHLKSKKGLLLYGALVVVSTAHQASVMIIGACSKRAVMASFAREMLVGNIAHFALLWYILEELEFVSMIKKQLSRVFES